VDRAGNISEPVSAGTEQRLIFLPLVIRANAINGQADMDQDSLVDHSVGGEAPLPTAANWLPIGPDDVHAPVNYRFKIRSVAAIQDGYDSKLTLVTVQR
jgi:hypothetical protein